MQRDETSGIPKRWRVFVFSSPIFIDADEHGNPKFSSIRIGKPLVEELRIDPDRHYHHLTYEARCARPVRADIQLAQAFGDLAVNLATQEQSGQMVGWADGKAAAIPLASLPVDPITGKLIPRRVDLSSEEFLSWAHWMWQNRLNG